MGASPELGEERSDEVIRRSPYFAGMGEIREITDSLEGSRQTEIRSPSLQSFFVTALRISHVSLV